MKLKNGLELQITPAQKEDSPKLLEYLNIVGGESHNLSFGKDGIKISVEDEAKFIESMENSNISKMFVAKIDGEIVGVSNINSSPKARLKHNGEIGVSVKKAYWSLGIAGFMMENLINFAKANNTTEVIHLSVISDNEKAIALYEKFGFGKIGLYKKYTKINDIYYDAILMNKYL
ncbi:MAG: GNAT family protein [Clostridia bacterium]